MSDSTSGLTGQPLDRRRFVKTAAAAGVKAFIQPGGSKKDGDVIARANELGLTVVLTGVRHFRH